MAINVSQPFHRTSAGPIDDSLNLSKAQMLTVNDNLMPSKWFTVCADDGKFYLYDKSNEPDEVTGKFRLYQEEEMPAEDMAEVVTPLPSIKRPYEVYSTKEQRIGFWVDGKPLYQKTIDCTSYTLTNQGSTEIQTGLDIVEEVIDIRGMIYDTGNNYYRTLPLIQDNNADMNSSSISFFGASSSQANRGKLIIWTRKNSAATSWQLRYITLQYTKTTDTPEPMYISIPVD